MEKKAFQVEVLLHVFVDESGDDGFSPSSTEWLVLAAVCFKDQELSGLSSKWRGCRVAAGRLAEHSLQWKNLGHSARKVVSQHIADLPGKIIAVAAHKPSLTAEQMLRLRCPRLYSLLTKLLTERISWYARECNEAANITFEDRPQVKFSELREYILETLRTSSRYARINYKYIAGFNSRKRSHENRLEISDCVASAFGAGLNTDRFGQIETTYALILLPRIWERNGNLFSYGLKPWPTNITPADITLFAEISEEIKKAPG